VEYDYILHAEKIIFLECSVVEWSKIMFCFKNKWYSWSGLWLCSACRKNYIHRVEWSMIMFCCKKKWYSWGGVEYDHVLHAEKVIFVEWCGLWLCYALRRNDVHTIHGWLQTSLSYYSPITYEWNASWVAS